MVTAERRQKQIRFHNADLYNSIQIPVRDYLLELTKDLELAVLLNQMIFSKKEYMTLNDIKRLSLNEKTKQTIRVKLEQLIEFGLIKKYKNNKIIYNQDLYTVSDSLTSAPEENNKILGIIVAVLNGITAFSGTYCYIQTQPNPAIFVIFLVCVLIGFILDIIISHKIYQNATNKYGDIYTILSILTLGILRPIFLFIVRNKVKKTNEIMERLENFERALKDILDEYENLGKELEKLRKEEKNKTTKFRELLGKKLVYSMIITIFKRYDLIDK